MNKKFDIQVTGCLALLFIAALYSVLLGLVVLCWGIIWFLISTFAKLI